MRVLEEMRGKGVAKALSTFIVQYVQTHFPDVKRLRISSQSHNVSSVQIHIKQASINLLPSPLLIASYAYVGVSSYLHRRCYLRKYR